MNIHTARKPIRRSGVQWSWFAALVLFIVSSTEAETIRYISKPLGDGRNPTFDFQAHNTTTPFTGEGETITVPRSIGSAVFAYKHGLDLTIVSLKANSLTINELSRVNGRQSQVLLPSVVPGVHAAAGAIAYTVKPSRMLRIGELRRVELVYPLGDKNSFVVSVGCHPTMLDGLAKLTSGTVASKALRPNEETELKIEADQPSVCGGQPLIVSAPACFKVKLKHPTFTSQLASNLSLTWPDSDPSAQTFTLKADSTCSTPNQQKEVTASLSGGALPRRPLVTWVQPTLLPPTSKGLSEVKELGPPRRLPPQP